MATETKNLGDSLDMGTANLLGRHTLEIAVIRFLSERSDLRGFLHFAAHFSVMALTGALVWLSRERWYLLVPAMITHGFTIVTMFAPMHECIHKTAFRSRRLNEIFGWIAGVIAFYNATYYRRYHTWHHRYTQDSERDPELSTPPPRSRLQYAFQVSGLPFWYKRPQELVKMAFGRLHKYPFIPADARTPVTISAALQVSVYVAVIAGSIISANEMYGGDLACALSSIEARTLIMPGSHDLYFTPEDSLSEARQIRRAEFLPIPSIWGHRAGNPLRNPEDEKFIRNAIARLLSA